MKNSFLETKKFVKFLKGCSVKNFRGEGLEILFQDNLNAMYATDKEDSIDAPEPLKSSVPDYVKDIEKAEKDFLKGA